MGIIGDAKSWLVKGEVKKSLSKLNPSLVAPALDNILDAICLNDKDKLEVKREIANVLMKLIRSLD